MDGTTTKATEEPGSRPAADGPAGRAEPAGVTTESIEEGSIGEELVEEELLVEEVSIDGMCGVY